MKKLFKNKKILLSLAVAGIIAASGLTYAWFRQTISTEANNINMGVLHLNAEVTSVWDDYHREPGEAGYTTYAFTNPVKYATIPTVDAMVKLDTVGSMFVRLVDWTAWKALDDEDAPLVYLPIQPVDPEFFAAYLEMEETMPFSMTSDGLIEWMLFQTTDEYNDANGLTTPEVYLYVMGGKNAGEAVVVPTMQVGMKLVGEGVDNNEYMGAVLLYGCVLEDDVWVEGTGKGELVVTQALETWNDGEFVEGAPYSEWGVRTDVDLTFLDFDDFSRYEGNAAPGTVSAYSANGITVEQAFQMVLSQIRR